MTTPALFSQTAPAGVLMDPALYLAGAGVALGNAAEKAIITNSRQVFGVAIPDSATKTVKYYTAKADGTADFEKGAKPQFGVNRQLLRVGLTVAAGVGIALIPRREVQAALLGVAGVAAAHVVQDVIPPLR